MIACFCVNFFFFVADILCSCLKFNFQKKKKIKTFYYVLTCCRLYATVAMIKHSISRELETGDKVETIRQGNRILWVIQWLL